MKIPKPYFKAVPLIGDLDLEYIFLEDLYPVFFTCINSAKKLFICLCCDVIEEQRWIVSPVKQFDILRMLKNRLTLYDLFKCEEGKRYIITWIKGIESTKIVEFIDIPNYDLPNVNEFFDADEDEYKEYMEFLYNKKYLDDLLISDSIKNKKTNKMKDIYSVSFDYQITHNYDNIERQQIVYVKSSENKKKNLKISITMLSVNLPIVDYVINNELILNSHINESNFQISSQLDLVECY
jgi:hypothetical protein